MTYDFDWAELAFSSKRPLTNLKATFIAAPRDISETRFTQIVKEYLPKGNILLGISKEAFVEGFENQPQFAMLQQKRLQKIIDKVNQASAHKVYTLHYFQRELVAIVDKLTPPRALFINGSWARSFHTLPIYYLLSKKSIPYHLIAAFSDEVEALAYEKATDKKIVASKLEGAFDEKALLMLTDEVAKASYDYGFQTGAILARSTKAGYQPVLSGFNKVVPFQTYALLHGASRETYFSPTNDQNHYDTIHAEMQLLTKALAEGISLKGLSLFVNLMPCPYCARTLSQTDITEVVYRMDHSEGYAANLLTKAGKTIRRIV